MWVHERERERERRFQERNCSRWKLRGNRLKLNILSSTQDPGSRSQGRVQEAYYLCNKLFVFQLAGFQNVSPPWSCVLVLSPLFQKKKNIYYMPSQSLPCEFHDTALCVWHWGQIDWEDSWAQEILCSVSLTGQLDTRDNLLCQFDRTAGHTRKFALSVWQDSWTQETLCSVSLRGELDTWDTLLC